MADETPKNSSSAVVRIWREPKERLVRVIEKKSKKERRPISEAEMVSKAVDRFCANEEKKLGL
jgi:hypothetical protein